MFRGHADQYSTDHLALQIAREAVDRGFDDQLEKEERTFLYMPFQHSESLADQSQVAARVHGDGRRLFARFREEAS